MSDLQPLLQRLKQGQWRWQLGRWQLWTAWSVAGVLGLWSGGQWWGWWGSQAPLSALVWLGLGLLLSALGALYIAKTAPSLLRVARRAEQHLGLQERLSTALEVAQQGPQHPVEHALLGDALAQLSKLQLSWERFSLAGPLRLGLALWVLGWLPMVLPSRLHPAPSEATSQAITQAVDPLKALVEALQQEASFRNDPYLQAEARHLEQLRSAAQQHSVGAQNLQQQVGESLQRVGQSLGLPPPSGQNVASPGAASGSLASAAASVQALAAQIAQRTQQLKALQAQRQADTSPHAAASNSPQNPQDCLFIEGHDCLTPEQVAQLEAGLQAPNSLRVAGPKGGAPGGSGDQGGKGSQAKLGSPQALSKQSAQATLALPQQAPKPSQRRIKLSAPTQAKLSAVQASGEAGAWRSAAESPLPPGLQSLDLEARSAVGAYFAREE